MHEEWIDRLSDLLDDELPPQEREAVEAHVARCPECARTLDELTRVAATARALPPRPPGRDLWDGIAGRLQPVPRESIVSRMAPWRSRAGHRPPRISFTVPQLAAASLLLAAVSGGLMWEVRGRSGEVRSARTAVTAEARPERSADGPARPDTLASEIGVTPVALADAEYDAAVADLERALHKGRGRLDPSTIATVEQNLQIIDRAIEQARQALESDPANSYLSGHLVETRRRKLDLLRHATALTTETN
jgi:putative zinc finger protein